MVSSFSCDKGLKAEVSKIIISRINKKAPMNVIICSPRGNVHRITQTDINSSVVSRLRKLSDSSSLTSSISMRGRSKLGGRKPGVKTRSKVQRIVDELVNCRSPNQQLLMLTEVLRNPGLREPNELISLSTSSSKTSNTLNIFLFYFDLMKQFKTSGIRSRSTLIFKAGKCSKIDNNAFCKSNKGRKSKSCATNSIIYSVLKCRFA